MKNNFFLYTGVWIFLIRLWMLVIIPIFLKDSRLITLLVKDGYHHWQFGIVLLVLLFIAVKIFKLSPKASIIFYSFCIGLVFDQTLYILETLGVDLKYEYLSRIDNLVTFILGLIFVGVYIFGLRLTEKE